MAKAGARLWAGCAYVIPHSGVLAGRAVEIGDRSWAVGPREASGPRRIGACRGSGRAKIRLSTVAIQDWCAENRAGYEARSQDMWGDKFFHIGVKTVSSILFPGLSCLDLVP